MEEIADQERVRECVEKAVSGKQVQPADRLAIASCHLALAAKQLPHAFEAQQMLCALSPDGAMRSIKDAPESDVVDPLPAQLLARATHQLVQAAQQLPHALGAHQMLQALEPLSPPVDGQLNVDQVTEILSAAHDAAQPIPTPTNHTNPTNLMHPTPLPAASVAPVPSPQNEFSLPGFADQDIGCLEADLPPPKPLPATVPVGTGGGGGGGGGGESLSVPIQTPGQNMCSSLPAVDKLIPPLDATALLHHHSRGPPTASPSVTGVPLGQQQYAVSSSPMVQSQVQSHSGIVGLNDVSAPSPTGSVPVPSPAVPMSAQVQFASPVQQQAQQAVNLVPNNQPQVPSIGELTQQLSNLRALNNEVAQYQREHNNIQMQLQQQQQQQQQQYRQPSPSVYLTTSAPIVPSLEPVSADTFLRSSTSLRTPSPVPVSILRRTPAATPVPVPPSIPIVPQGFVAPDDKVYEDEPIHGQQQQQQQQQQLHQRDNYFSSCDVSSESSEESLPPFDSAFDEDVATLMQPQLHQSTTPTASRIAALQSDEALLEYLTVQHRRIAALPQNSVNASMLQTMNLQIGLLQRRLLETAKQYAKDGGDLTQTAAVLSSHIRSHSSVPL